MIMISLAQLLAQVSSITATVDRYRFQATCDVLANGNQATTAYEVCSISTINTIMENDTSPPTIFRVDQAEPMVENTVSGETTIVLSGYSISSILGGGTNTASTYLPPGSWGNDDDDVPIPDSWRRRSRRNLREATTIMKSPLSSPRTEKTTKATESSSDRFTFLRDLLYTGITTGIKITGGKEDDPTTAAADGGGSVIVGNFKELYEKYFMDCLVAEDFWFWSGQPQPANIDCTGHVLGDN